MSSMKKQYDFSRGRRGAVLPDPPGKTRITIRIDNDLLGWFRRRVHEAGGGNYQTLINAALREHVTGGREALEQTLRRVLRQEIRKSMSGEHPVDRAYGTIKGIKTVDAVIEEMRGAGPEAGRKARR